MHKNKYSIKYQHGGSWANFKNTSACETNKYQFNLSNDVVNTNCPNSFYNYTGFEQEQASNKCEKYEQLCKNLGHANVSTDGAKCLDCLKDAGFKSQIDPEDKEIINHQSTRYKINYEIEKVCNSIVSQDLYFSQSPVQFHRAVNIESGDNFPNNVQTNILLSTANYFNLPVDINLQSGKHLICLEGNFIYVDHTCRVASGYINTCLFVGLEFDDLSCVLFHINGMLSKSSLTNNYISNKISYPMEPTDIFNYLKTNFAKKLASLNKIYLVGICNDYYLSDYSDGFDWIDGQMSIGNMNNLEIIRIIKTKLNVPVGKRVKLIKFNSPGDYIYSNNTMYKMEKI